MDDAERLGDTGATPLPREHWNPRLRRWEAAEYLAKVHGLQIAPATLAKLASIGGGPNFHAVPRMPLYPIAELDRWAAKRLGRLVTSTSECRSMVRRARGDPGP